MKETIKLKVKVKDDKLSNSLLASIDAINQINESTSDSLSINYSELTSITPLFILPLVVYLNGCNKKIENIDLTEQLNLIRFSDGLLPDNMRKSEFIATMERYSSEKYIPIINFPATKERDDEKDAILSTVESIIVKQLGIDANVAMGIKYMIGETIDNIIQHANSERGYIFAKSFPEKGFLDICIADSGITLLGSYNTLIGNEISSDLEAIQAANRGISTKNLPNAENRGYGIITSKKMLIEGLKGSFIMMSGNALHLYNDKDKRFIETPNSIRWNGTIVALRIPYINKEFQYINYIE